MITAPGIYTDVDAATYHGDPLPEPSLSSSIARVLLDQSPAHAFAAHPRLNPAYEADDRNDRKMEIGTVAHAIALGAGRAIAVIDAETYQTKAAKEARAAAIAEGKSPILTADYDRARAAADALRRESAGFPDVTWAFGDGGMSEVVLAWQDAGQWCRAMVDRLRIEGDRAVIVDLKFTAESAHPEIVSRRIYQMGYDMQACFYRRGLAVLKPEVRRVAYYIATTETEAPYGFSCLDLDQATWGLGEKRVRAALGLWANCRAAGLWPSYPRAIATAALPPWMETRWLEREVNDAALVENAAPFADLMTLQPPPAKKLMGAV